MGSSVKKVIRGVATSVRVTLLLIDFAVPTDLLYDAWQLTGELFDRALLGARGQSLSHRLKVLLGKFKELAHTVLRLEKSPHERPLEHSAALQQCLCGGHDHVGWRSGCVSELGPRSGIIVGSTSPPPRPPHLSSRHPPS